MTTLTVETGSIVPNANSYISLTDAQTYWTNMGYTSAQIGTDSTAQTNALWMAGYAMERLFGRFYMGKIAKHSPQSMLWPRQRFPDETVCVQVTDPTGNGAVLVARVLDGAIANVYVVQGKGGAGYSSTPTIQFVDYYGSGATATATVVSGAITAVTVNTGGCNYSTPVGIRTNDSIDVAINSVPQALRDAQCELAVLCLVNGNAALYPNESETRYLQQEIDELGVGLNLRRQYFNKEVMDIERYEGFRKIELQLWAVLNRTIMVM